MMKSACAHASARVPLHAQTPEPAPPEHEEDEPHRVPVEPPPEPPDHNPVRRAPGQPDVPRRARAQSAAARRTASPMSSVMAR